MKPKIQMKEKQNKSCTLMLYITGSYVYVCLQNVALLQDDHLSEVYSGSM